MDTGGTKRAPFIFEGPTERIHGICVVFEVDEGSWMDLFTGNV